MSQSEYLQNTSQITEPLANLPCPEFHYVECESLLFLPERRLFLHGDSSTGPAFFPLSSSMNLISICFIEVDMMFLSSSEA
jgi:hypothetical protein